MKIHFIGIGGIGVSALAQYYLAQGHWVSGSDLVKSEITDFLAGKGVKIKIGEQRKENLPLDAGLVIFSPAVKENNLELKAAREKEKRGETRVMSYPQALGELTKKYFTIAVSGTHGKSTTTAMVSLILEKAGLDPTVIIGTKLKEFGGSNFRPGRSQYLVIEADEWQASFLNYWPKIIILTNIEKEHLDYYRDIRHILKTYREYLTHLPPDGVLIVNGGDENIRKIILDLTGRKNKKNKQSFLICDFQDLKRKEWGHLKKILKIPGEHNILNASAALAVARFLRIPVRISFRALALYCGAWRRFEEFEAVCDGKFFKLVNDYGHHPTEILATAKAAREKFKNKKIWLIFQPHQHQRTFFLFDEFVKTFREIKENSLADEIIITDIFDVAGREEAGISKRINSKKLVKKINRRGVIYLPLSKITAYLRRLVGNDEVAIIMGAGDIYKLQNSFKRFSPQS